MQLLPYIIIFAVFLACAQLRYFYFAHMFQLNSYHHDMHWTWLKKNYLRNLTVIMPVKAKKAFAFTARMKRLCVTFNVLMLALFAAVFLKNTVPYWLIIFPLALLFIYQMIPFVMLLCDILNKPIEKMVNNHYINDAKRILESLPNLRVIGVTGSYGKTTVKHFITELLKVKHEALCTPASYNTTLGVVRTIRESLKPTHEFFVCEMGARRRGDIKEICDLVRPEIGVLTTIGYEHLDTQGTIENIIHTNFELIESLPEHGIGVINFDNDYIRGNHESKQSPKIKVRYGIDGLWDYHAHSLRYSNEGTAFTIVADMGDKQESVEFRTDVLGEHNVLNITAAVACANMLGIPMADLVPAVKRLEGVPHRLQLVRRGNLSIIDDAYNSNPEGAKSALNVLDGFKGLKVLITPGMIELGDKEAQMNFEFGVAAAAVCDMVILIGRAQTKDIHRGLFSANFPVGKVVIKEQFLDGFAVVNELAEKQKVAVLLENDLPDNY